MSVPSAGTVLGKKYRVIASIGEGAMGTVFRAQNIVTGKLVALKWMHPHIAANPDSSTRLLREAQAASRLNHPNVVDVYDIVQDDKTLFLVMELLQGETLRDYLQRERQPKISEFVALMLPALAGLAAAHEQGVIHRDLKPDNIFLVRTPGSLVPTAKVVDFGVAKLEGDAGLNLTGTGCAIGTPLYMSLEQLSGDKNIDARTDVYAFGVILYEAIAGRVPYSASTLSELAIKVLTTQPVPLKLLRPDVPATLLRIVDRAIAKRREERLPSAAALLQELATFARVSSLRPETTNPGVRTWTQSDRDDHAGAFATPAAGTLAPSKTRKHPRAPWLAVVTVVLGAAVTALVWMSHAEPTMAPPGSDNRRVAPVAESGSHSAEAVGLAPALPAAVQDAGTNGFPLGEADGRPLPAAAVVSSGSVADSGLRDAARVVVPPLAAVPKHRHRAPLTTPPKLREPPRTAKPAPTVSSSAGQQSTAGRKSASDELAF